MRPRTIALSLSAVMLAVVSAPDSPAGTTGADLVKWQNTKPDTLTITRDGRPVVLTGEALARWKYQRYMQDYLATVQSIDDNVGRLLDYLDRNGLARNTIVIYTSDQGFFLGDHGLFDKRCMYEESLRMPFLVRWPAVIRPGSRSDGMALNIDFAPTFLEAARLPVPDAMQGHSFLPLLRGRMPPGSQRSRISAAAASTASISLESARASWVAVFTSDSADCSPDDRSLIRSSRRLPNARPALSS